MENLDQELDQYFAKETPAFQGRQDDPGFLVAKGRFNVPDSERATAEKNHVHKLANAIFMAISNHGYANIRCIGRNAAYNAIKAIAVAKGPLAPKGITLLWDVSFEDGNLGELRNKEHVSEVTALVFSVRDFKENQNEE